MCGPRGVTCGPHVRLSCTAILALQVTVLVHARACIYKHHHPTGLQCAVLRTFPVFLPAGRHSTVTPPSHHRPSSRLLASLLEGDLHNISTKSSRQHCGKTESVRHKSAQEPLGLGAQTWDTKQNESAAQRKRRAQHEPLISWCPLCHGGAVGWRSLPKFATSRLTT